MALDLVLTLNAMKSAFLSFDGRLRIINEQIKPGYALLAAKAAHADMAGQVIPVQ